MMEQTQQKIIDAAIEVFDEDLSAPLEKVADRAEVTRRTLHRYFKDRSQLLVFCEKDMQNRCREAMMAALESSSDPKVQLENMLYAGIDCGAKYSFFHKQHMREGHQHKSGDEDCAAFDSIDQQFFNVIASLKSEARIKEQITLEWVKMLFASIVAATVNGKESDKLLNSDLKNLAWYSFSNGIGLI
ncbi:MAG: TetR/AcrR family transcriptional regulator [Sphingobacteriales bacterium]|nr:MAG: TetR/AcrR family transcriptional regulator [Sphingobacteriales bacterium]